MRRTKKQLERDWQHYCMECCSTDGRINAEMVIKGMGANFTSEEIKVILTEALNFFGEPDLAKALSQAKVEETRIAPGVKRRHLTLLKGGLQ